MLKQDIQNIVSGVDRTYLHCFRRIAGNPSGPEAAFGFSSSIADIISVSEKCRFCNLALVFEFIWSITCLGDWNILLYCSARISAICSLFSVNWPNLRLYF